MCDQNEKILFFNVIAKTVITNGSLNVDKWCNSVEVINVGTNVVTVNQIPLNPPAAGKVLGDSWTFGGNRAEVYKGRIDVAFATLLAGQKILVLQKMYLPESIKFLDDVGD